MRDGSCASTAKFFTISLTVGEYPGAPKDRKPAGEDGVYRKGVVSSAGTAVRRT